MLAILAMALFCIGCGQPEDHAHEQGEHGGIVFSVGDAHYHGEAVFAEGEFSLYMLDHDQFRVLEIEEQNIETFMRPFGDAKAFKVILEPRNQSGDSEGKSSRFVGALPADLPAKPLYIVFPSITVDGSRYRFSFSTQEAIMPTKVTDAEEQELYLKPGGLYTEEDIAANKSQTASQRYVGFKATHDNNPKPGDPICPISLTVANPKCSWIIGGQEYTFCCPPCIDEFLKKAKTDPSSIEPAKRYVKE